MKKIGFWLCAVLVVVSIYGAERRREGQSSDEKQIRALEDRFAAAFRAKDVEAIMSAYAPGGELVVFDVIPPRQYVGFDAYKKDWQDFFALFPGPVDKFEITDLSVATDRNLAYGHSIQRSVMTKKDGSKMDFTARVTDCYRKMGGKWLVTHEHVSVPVDLNTGKPDFESKP